MVAKEIGKALAADSFRCQLDARGIRKEAMLFSVVLVHPMEQVAQRLPSAGQFADVQVQQDPENLALVVVADAPLRRSVERVAFEPGIETRFFRRLPAMRRTALQLGDFAGKRL